MMYRSAGGVPSNSATLTPDLWPIEQTITTAVCRNDSAAEPCSTMMKATRSMSNTPGRLLRQFSDDITDLAERVVLSTAIVKGQAHDFEATGLPRTRP